MNDQMEKSAVLNDEIQLSEIFEAVKGGWKHILGCSLTGAVLAVALAWAVPKKYEVLLHLDQPLVNQLFEVNLGRTALTGLPTVTPDEVYGYFKDELLKDSSKLRFFNEIYLPAQDEQPDTPQKKNALQDIVLKKQVKVIEPSAKGRQEYQLRVEAPTAELAVQWATGYLQLTEKASKDTWVADVKSTMNLAIQNTERDLEEKYALAAQTRQDRRIQLEEALQVAKAIGQDGPQLMTGQLPRQDDVASFADGSRLYARGAKSLEAELKVLKARVDDTPFMDGLRDAQTKLKLLKQQKPEEQKIQMLRIDGDVFEPVSPFFPKKSIFLAIGLFFGAGLGFLWALKNSGIFKRMY